MMSGSLITLTLIITMVLVKQTYPYPEMGTNEVKVKSDCMKCCQDKYNFRFGELQVVEKVEKYIKRRRRCYSFCEDKPKIQLEICTKDY